VENNIIAGITAYMLKKKLRIQKKHYPKKKHKDSSI